MAQSAHSQSEEYWRPADPVTARIARPIMAAGLCPDCGAEYSTGDRFCHACGTERNRRPVAASSPMTFADFFDLAVIRQRCGLSVPSMVFFVLGITCLVIASVIGVLYKGETLVQWQALQFWRVEWLLGAAATMLAGILLKREAR
jgi:zinc-ribbon domain